MVSLSIDDLTGLKEQYEKDGFAIIRNVVDADLIQEVSQHVDWLCQKYPELRPEHLHHPLMRDDAFWVRLVTDERFVKIVSQLLGPNLACFTAHYICKPPRDGYAVFWHQDGAYWRLDPLEAVTLWLAVDETNPERGCLRMIPGSHKLPLQPIQYRSDIPNMLSSSLANLDLVDEAKAVDVILKPGDVSIHHPCIIHGSEQNTSSYRRCGLDLGFMKASTKITNTGLYLNPILVSGKAVASNYYRAWPLYQADQTIPFRGDESWNNKAQYMNQRFNHVQNMNEDPLAMTKRMMQRLDEGTVKS
ncbi:phytanoyl-CoA dioxygenase family protein [Brasilonema sp. CT11]|nr:phytanoyl-CoA dioxygenase family protein [Brasilonema sp. CT11]